MKLVIQFFGIWYETLIMTHKCYIWYEPWWMTQTCYIWYKTIRTTKTGWIWYILCITKTFVYGMKYEIARVIIFFYIWHESWRVTKKSYIWYKLVWRLTFFAYGMIFEGFKNSMELVDWPNKQYMVCKL